MNVQTNSPSLGGAIFAAFTAVAFGGLAYFQYRERAKNAAPLMYASIAVAEAAFKEYGIGTKAQKDNLIGHLVVAYRELHFLVGQEGSSVMSPRLRETAAKIFYLYGRCLYGGNFEASRQMFQAALAVQLVGAKVLNAKILSSLLGTGELEDLPAYLSNRPDAFKRLDKLLDSNPVDELAEMVPKTDREQAFSIAMSLKWLGFSCQNITVFKTKANLERFETIYGFAKKILVRLDTADSRWEVGQILYNTGRFIHYLRTPDDVAGAVATLKEVFPYLEAEGKTARAQGLRAQIHNISSIEFGKIKPKDEAERRGQLKRQYEEIAKASEIAEKTAGFDPFLKTMFLNNKARAAFECIEAGDPVATIEEVDRWIREVLETIAKEEYNHSYHAIYLLSAAKFESKRGNKAKALEYLALSERVNLKFAASNQDIQEKVEALRKTLTETQTDLRLVSRSERLEQLERLPVSDETLQRMYLVRHGESTSNIYFERDGKRVRYVSGHSPEIHLTEAGRTQILELARKLAERFPRDARLVITSSTAVRTQETAQILFAELSRTHSKVVLVEDVYKGLNERHLGDWEGKIRDESYTKAESAWKRMPAAVKFSSPEVEGGESYKEVAARALPTLAEIHSRYSGSTIIAVTSFNTINATAIQMNNLSSFLPAAPGSDLPKLEIGNGDLVLLETPQKQAFEKTRFASHLKHALHH